MRGIGPVRMHIARPVALASVYTWRILPTLKPTQVGSGHLMYAVPVLVPG